MADSASDCLVVGLGAVGTLLAGSLAAGGLRVTAVGRGLPDGALGNRTFTVRRRAGETRALVGVCGTLEEALARRPPVVAVAVKAYDVAALATQLADAMADRAAPGPPPALACFTNGVGPDELLATRFPHWAVIPGTLTAAALLEMDESGDRPGHDPTDGPRAVRVPGRGGFALAPPIGGGVHSSAPATLLGALRKADQPTGFVTDGRSLKWSKLLLNMIASASSAALDWLPHQVMSHPGLVRLEEEAWREAAGVMNAAGIAPVDLPGYRVRTAARLVSSLPSGWARPLLVAAGRGRGERAPGPLSDLRRGRQQTEVAWLQGAVAAEAERLGMRAPVNAGLAAVVIAIASGELSWDEVRGRPDALLALVHEWGDRREIGAAPPLAFTSHESAPTSGS